LEKTREDALEVEKEEDAPPEEAETRQ